MSDLTLPTARAERDGLADRVDVLDKVGLLATLPDGMHVTTPMVATFYEVPVETIRSLVLDNRAEIESDGYRVATRSAFLESFPEERASLDQYTRQIALFPRRAVLRVGMLLRDSEVAKKVRTYLLDAEAGARVMSDDEIVLQALQIQGRKIAALTERVAELEPKAIVADKLLDAHGDLCVRDAAQSLSRAGVGVGQNRLFTLMDRKYGWISRSLGDHRYRARQTAIDAGYLSVLPQSHYHPRTGVLVLDPPQIRVTPKGMQRILLDYNADRGALV